MENEILERLSIFHGHLGPYVVLGYRMGEIANEELGEDHFVKNVLAKTGTEPPVSCIIDGVQFSSGCTLGKGNIQVEDDDEAKVIFSRNERELEIEVKEKVQEKIKNLNENGLEDFSKKVFTSPIHALFEIKSSSSR